MTNEIQAELKNYILVFKDRSTRNITTMQYENIMRNSVEAQSEVVKIDVDGQMYDMNSVAKLLPLQEYYEQYPDKRPVNYNSPKIEEDIGVPLPNLRRTMALVKGLEQVVQDRGWDNISDGTKELVKKWRKQVEILSSQQSKR